MVWLIKTSAKVFLLATILCLGMMIGNQYENQHLLRFSDKAQVVGEDIIRFGVESWPEVRSNIDYLTKRIESSMKDR